MIVDQPEEEELRIIYTDVWYETFIHKYFGLSRYNYVVLLKFCFFYIFRDTELWVPFFDLRPGIMAQFFSKWHIPIT